MAPRWVFLSALVAVTASTAYNPLSASNVLNTRDSSGCPNNLEVSYAAPAASKGWSYRVAVKGLKKPRTLVFDNNGGLLVVESGSGIYRLAIDQDHGETCVVMSQPKVVVNSTELNHGLAISVDGKTLYASSWQKVFAWPYSSESGTVTGPNFTVIANMSDTDKTTRTLLTSQKKPGMLIVSRGTVEDNDDEARSLKSGHSQLRAFEVSTRGNGTEPFSFMDGVLLGWGLRNSVGVAEDPAKGGIWSVENSVDELTRNGEDIQDDNPGEELNYHGVLNDSSTAGSQGGNYGFPLCYTLWNTTDFPDLGSLKPGDQFPGPDAPTFTDETCNKDYVAPRLAFQAHSAPLDIKFSKDGSKAMVAFHGSWNRKSPVGYRIASIPFDVSTGEPSAQKSSTAAATDILSTPDLAKCPDGCFRPVSLAWDAKDRLWFTSDSTGEIFVLYQNGSSTGDGNTGSSDGVQSVIAEKAAVWAVALAAVVTCLLLAL